MVLPKGDRDKPPCHANRAGRRSSNATALSPVATVRHERLSAAMETMALLEDHYYRLPTLIPTSEANQTNLNRLDLSHFKLRGGCQSHPFRSLFRNKECHQPGGTDVNRQLGKIHFAQQTDSKQLSWVIVFQVLPQIPCARNSRTRALNPLDPILCT